MRRARLRWWAGVLALAGMAGVVAVFVVAALAWWWWPVAEEPVAKRPNARVVHRKRSLPPLQRPVAPASPSPREDVARLRVMDQDADVELDSGDVPAAEPPPWVEVSGVVIDTEGRPVSEASVDIRLVPDDGYEGWPLGFRNSVDVHGAFRVDVPPGLLSLRAYRRDGGIAYPSEVVEIDAGPGEGVELTLVLPAERVGGFGMSFELADGEALVQYAIPGTPAAALGLRPGDAVLAIDGVEVADLDESDFVSRIAGPEGTHVEVTVRIGDSVEEHTIVRTYIEQDEESGEPYGDPVPGLDLVDPQVDTGGGWSPSDTGKAPMLGVDTGTAPDTGG